MVGKGTGELGGAWRVERLSGLLPPRILRKRIDDESGWTLLGPVPLAFFRRRGTTLDYVALPVRDELTRREDGQWIGRGLLLGREFCRFRLVRDTRRSDARVSRGRAPTRARGDGVRH